VILTTAIDVVVGSAAPY